MGESSERKLRNLGQRSQVRELKPNEFLLSFDCVFLISLLSSLSSSKIISAYLETSNSKAKDLAKKEVQPFVERGELILSAAE